MPGHLKERRMNLGLSLREMANEIGISASMLHRAEAGGGLHPATQKKIADHFGCQVTDLWPVVEAKESVR